MQTGLIFGRDEKALKKLIMSGLNPFYFVNKIRLKIARNYSTDRTAQGTQPLRRKHLLSQPMIKLPMLSLFSALILSSCSEFITAKIDGIHSVKSSIFAKIAAKSSSSKSPNGFHPAPVCEIAVKKGSKFPKDKYGTPSYGHRDRNRVVANNLQQGQYMSKE